MESALHFANWSTLLVCMVIKLPQVVAVLGARSARGLSLESLLLELSGFLVFLRYQSYYDYPLQTYLEYPILVAQGSVLFLLLNIALTLVSLRARVPDFCILVSSASKFAQLRCLWQTKDSGQVSALTWSMSAYTCASKQHVKTLGVEIMGVFKRDVNPHCQPGATHPNAHL
uniref:Solute carrier family 66 member 3 n=1 Tax=Sphenodon punctatus TaxID=8508 RepID=A0A8D0G3Y3_SPHPU